MIHRHLKTTDWSMQAIDSLFERGTAANWREFVAALRPDAELAMRTLRVCEFTEDQESAALARFLISRLHPALGSADPRIDPRG